MNITDQTVTAEWLPISTAPRDGQTDVILRFQSSQVSRARFIPGMDLPWRLIESIPLGIACSRSLPDGPGGPSHWQPMPTAEFSALAYLDALRACVLSECAPADDAWPAYIAQVIETYIQQNRTDEDRETGIRKIIERRIHHMKKPEPAPASGAVAEALRAFVDIKPLGYGAPGTRDIDIAQWNEAYRAAKLCLGALASPGAAIVEREQEKCLDCGDAVPKHTCYCQAGCVHATGFAGREDAPAVSAETPSAKQQKLLTLADRIDHEELWRWPGMDHHKMTPEQRDRMNAGVALRRYARLWAPGHWVVFPPIGPVSFSATTLDKAVEMARRSTLPAAPEPDDTPLETGEGDAR